MHNNRTYPLVAPNIEDLRSAVLTWTCAILGAVIVLTVQDWLLLLEILGMLTATLVVWSDASLGPLVLLLLVPFNMVRVLPGGTPVSSELLKIPVVAIVFLAWVRREKIRSLRTAITVPILIYIGLLLLSIARADDSSFAYKEIARALSNFAIFYLMLVGVRSEIELRRSINAVLLVAALIAAYGLYQAYVGDYGAIAEWFNAHVADLLADWRGRITSILYTDNELGAYLDLCWPFALLYSAKVNPGRTRSKVLSVGVAALFLFALMLTFSRGAWLGCIASFLLITFMSGKKHPKLLFSLVLVIVGVTATLSAFGLWQGIIDRGSAVEPEIVASRFSMWLAALTLFSQHPIVGIGYGNFLPRYGSLVPSSIPSGVIGAHNVYLFTLAQLGLIGCFALLWIIGGTAYLSLRDYRRYPADDLSWFMLASGCSLLTVLIHGFFDDVGLFAMHTQFLVFSILGLTHAALRIRSEQRASKISKYDQ